MAENSYQGPQSATCGRVGPITPKTPRSTRGCKRQASREPSLVIGKGHVSWSMVSLLALTRQKQLAKSSPQARHVFSKTAFLKGTSVTSVLPRPSQKVLLRARNGPQETNHKNIILFNWASTYAFGSMFSMDALRNKSKGWFCKLHELQLGGIS